jgi:hypothetical protein
VRGNSHAQFLEGWAAARSPGYSVHTIWMETCADELAQQCLPPIQILSLEPEHRKNRLATTGAVKDRTPGFAYGAQAACAFS